MMVALTVGDIVCHSLSERDDHGPGHVAYRRWEAGRLGDRHRSFREIYTVIFGFLHGSLHFGTREPPVSEASPKIHKTPATLSDLHLLPSLPKHGEHMLIFHEIAAFEGAINRRREAQCFISDFMFWYGWSCQKVCVCNRGGLAWTQITHSNWHVTGMRPPGAKSILLLLLPPPFSPKGQHNSKTRTEKHRGRAGFISDREKSEIPAARPKSLRAFNNIGF